MDLLKIKLPSTVEVEGVFYEVVTDFRAWLKFDRLLKNNELTQVEYNSFFINKIPQDTEKGLKALIDFFNPPQVLPRKMGGGNGEPVIDYELDGDLIYSAFYEQYKIDLMATNSTGHGVYIHWHKFLALLNGLHNTRLNEVMGYRAYNENDKTDYKKYQIQLKNAWRIPTKESEKDKRAREEFNALFEKPAEK